MEETFKFLPEKPAKIGGRADKIILDVTKIEKGSLVLFLSCLGWLRTSCQLTQY